MADPAPSEDASSPSDKAPADTGLPRTPSKVDGTAFANTRQHVAGKQTDGETIERFTNTKLNIALINDPKNGPRFTMTKREAGLDDADPASDTFPSENPSSDEPQAVPDRPVSASALAPTPVRAAVDDRAFDPASDRTLEEARRPVEIETQALSLAKPPPPDMPPAAEAQHNQPTVDSSKTFVGHNGTYYDESWRWMDWRGTYQSWNWPAALSLGHWFAFRRLYTLAGLYLGWLAALAAALVNDIPVLGLVLAAVVIIGLAGVYGNILYFRAFRRAVGHITRSGEGGYEDQRSQLAQAGGTSPLALGIMGVLSITGIAGALAATYYLRGGFSLNLWPF